ncbi:ATP-binding cassette sub- B member 6, mitochondrial [Linnemannia zychae]|nr:ATP-binding cassette sub- B member 6, mitochondrial [Linnemannia zychae]
MFQFAVSLAYETLRIKYFLRTAGLYAAKDISQDDSHKDEKKSLGDNGSSLPNQSTYLDGLLLRFYQLISATYIVDLIIVGYRLSQTYNDDPTISSQAMAKIAAWIAFLVNWTILASETKVTKPRWLFFIHHFIGWIALVGSLFSIFPYLVQGSRTLASGELFGPKTRLSFRILFPSITKDVFEKVLIGTFVLRLCLQAAIVALSATYLFTGAKIKPVSLPKSLLKDSRMLQTAPIKLASESSEKAEELKKHDIEQQFRANALKSVFPKILLSIRVMFPEGNRKIQFLFLVKIAITSIERVIRALIPLQTERLLRVFSLSENNVNGSAPTSKFDIGSILLYVFYKFLQRHSSFLSLMHDVVEEPINSFVTDNLRLRYFEHAHSLSMKYHYEKKPYEVMNLMESGVHAITGVARILLFTLIPTVCDVLFTFLYFSLVWGWKYGMLIAISASVSVFFSVRTERMMTRQRREMIQKSIVSNPTESLMNIETVKYFANEAFEVGRYQEHIKSSRGNTPAQGRRYRLTRFIQSVIWTGNLLAGCLLCAYEISHGLRDPASFLTFVIYSQQLEGPILTLSSITNQLRHVIATMDEMIEFLNEEPTVMDIPGASPLVISGGRGGDIEFENVSFQYGPDKKGLSNISFKVPKGKMVGIVGPTGGGKSTILRLLVRLWDPTAGRILIDGQDISKVTQQSLREHIGIIPQDIVLFYDTIGYNINYGRTTATKDEIEAAAKIACIHDSIMSFEKGYETSIGNRGVKLSGGERQRISIARTVLKNPSIIVMDEATSALDSMTESNIQQALNKMTEGRTTIAVAHRLSTIIHADLILYVKDGEIVERGTHEELIQAAKNNGGQGEYYKMWRIQTGNYDDCSSTVGDSETETCVDNEDRNSNDQNNPA